MQNDLINVARARRRVALTHVTSLRKYRDGFDAVRNFSGMTPAEMGDVLRVRRMSHTENIFAA